MIVCRYCEEMVWCAMTRCREMVSGGSSWQDAVRAIAQPKRRAKWEDINGNSERDQAMVCRICKHSFGGPLLPGEAVEVWIGGRSNVWKDSARVVTGTIVSESSAHFSGGRSERYIVAVWFPGARGPKEADKPAEFLRRKAKEADEKIVVASGDEKSQARCRELTSLVEKGVLTQKEMDMIANALPSTELCNHDVCDPATTCASDPKSIDHFNFALRDGWDLVKLFVPFNGGKGPPFDPRWEGQDATNLTNLIMSIGDSDHLCKAASNVKDIRNQARTCTCALLLLLDTERLVMLL